MASDDTVNNKRGAEQMDLVSTFGGMGAASSSIFNVFRGLNTIGGVPFMPSYTDNQGYIFFTKPTMNLNPENVIASRRLSALRNQRRDSAANAFRCMLSPSVLDYNKYNGKNRSSLVDDKNPFITLLGNSLISITGWPDFVPDIYKSSEGMAKQEVAWLEDRWTEYRAWSASAEFQETDGSPVNTLFTIWTEYATRISEGSTMSPYYQNILNDRVDYQTKIIRLVMDNTNTYVQNTATTIAFPRVAPNGVRFNMNRASAVTENANITSMEFQCIGLEKDDPITVYEFNKLVTIFNSDMLPDRREKRMRKLQGMEEKRLFSFKDIYPWIADDMELEWYVEIDLYNLVEKAYKLVHTDAGFIESREPPEEKKPIVVEEEESENLMSPIPPKEEEEKKNKLLQALDKQKELQDTLSKLKAGADKLKR